MHVWLKLKMHKISMWLVQKCKGRVHDVDMIFKHVLDSANGM